MMRPLVIILLIAALVMTTVAINARRLAVAQSSLHRAARQLNQTVQQINRINELQSQQQQVESREKPPQAIIAQVNAVLAEIGVDLSTLGGVTPQGDEPLRYGRGEGGNPYRAQSVQVILRALSVRDIARFLHRWTEEHPIWRPVQIQLSHDRGGGSDDDRFDLTLVLRAIYLAESPSTSET